MIRDFDRNRKSSQEGLLFNFQLNRNRKKVRPIQKNVLKNGKQYR